jgi:hypothetical protein
MESISNFIFSHNGKNTVIICIDTQLQDNFCIVNLNIGDILKRRLLRSDLPLDTFYISSPQKDLFNGEINYDIVVFCNTLPSEIKEINFCKKICEYFEKNIVKYYTNQEDLMKDYPEAFIQKDKKVNFFNNSAFPSPYNSPAFDRNPSRIYENLYLGDEYAGADENFLKEKNITAIATVMQEPHPFSSDKKYVDFRFHHIPILDKTNVNIIEYIPEFIKFMEECYAENRIVYIHCQMGISRSVSFVIAYIMQKENKKLNDAFKFVKDRRPQADPNFGFMCQLMTYEKTLDL